VNTVVVLGSANLDLVFGVASIPRPGETVLASGQQQHPGGKGLNQAVAAARAGAPTVFIGAVGDDSAADRLIGAMAGAGIDTSQLRQVHGPSGTAIITVDEAGENAIVVAAGANEELVSIEPGERALIEAATVLIAQLEVPLATVTDAAAIARAAGTTVVLNAAPAQTLDRSLLTEVDVLVVNEHEARILAGLDAGAGEVIALARLLAAHVPTVVVTMGAEGAVWFGGAGEGSVAAPRATVVDTTGAGDTFTGVLGAGLADGLAIGAAVERAVVAGAISVETAGAVPSIPMREQIDARMARP
jgi:ribokinase